MIRKDILFAVALGSCFGCATVFAQNDTAGAGATAATPAAPTTQTSGDDVIHLHLPVHHRARHAHAAPKPAGQTEPGDTATIDSIGADTAALPPAAAPVSTAQTPTPSRTAPPATKAAHEPATQAAPTIPFSFGEDSGTPPPETPGSTGGLKPQAAATAHEAKTASVPPRPGTPKATPVPVNPVREAARTNGNEHTGLAKRGAVLFDKGVSNPSPQQFDGLKVLAGDLSTAVEAGRGPVQLEAYAGGRGDKSSDARRLSLKRAIAVRQLLIDNGVPSSRIIVRAMGGTDDTGPSDRVDVFVRAS